MKKIFLVCIGLSLLLLNCREPILIPIVGAVEGTVLDSHNEPISGVEVIITHIPASESSEASESTVSTMTDFEGKFILDEVWDEYRIDVIKSGFKSQSEHHHITNGAVTQVIDFTMIGRPEASKILLNRAVLSSSDTTDLTVLVSVEDEYNEITSGYTGNLMLTDDQGVLQSSMSLSVKAEGVGAATLEAIISPGILSAGIYNLSASVIDPDGNQIISNTDQKLTIED